MREEIKRRDNEKPIITLSPIWKIAVHTPDRLGSNTFLRVAECGGWRFADRTFPTRIMDGYRNGANIWDRFGKNTCYGAGVKGDGKNEDGKFLVGSKNDFNTSRGWATITLDEFFDFQNRYENLILDEVSAVNEWFNYGGRKK